MTENAWEEPRFKNETLVIFQVRTKTKQMRFKKREENGGTEIKDGTVDGNVSFFVFT